MDPYIEACGLWEDFHGHLIEQLAETLADAVPEHYVVRTGERAYLVLAEREGAQEHSFKPDVEILASAPAAHQTESPLATVDASSDVEVATMRALIPTEYREAFIDIYALRPKRELITSIEVLSPSNKRFGSEGWELYLRKRRGLLLGAANLIEIDLLRGGQRMPMRDPWPDSPYTLLVGRRESVPVCRVWPAGSQRALPTIPVPLAPPDADVPLCLQPLIAAIYARFRYDQDIDYSRPLDPPLNPTEVAWLEQQLRLRQS
jgi:hypothetical protein